MCDRATEPLVANITMRMVLNALADVMGPRGLRMILSLAGLTHYIDALPAEDFAFAVPYRAISSMTQAIEAIYGPRGLRMFMSNTGRGCFVYLLSAVPDLFLSLRAQIDRDIPPATQLWQAACSVGEATQQFIGMKASVRNDAGVIDWALPYTCESWGRQSPMPVCWSTRTALASILGWLADSRSISVSEIMCSARGDLSCTFRISTPPPSDNLPLPG